MSGVEDGRDFTLVTKNSKMRAKRSKAKGANLLPSSLTDSSHDASVQQCLAIVEVGFNARCWWHVHVFLCVQDYQSQEGRILIRHLFMKSQS